MDKNAQLLQVAQDLIGQLIGFMNQTTLPPHSVVKAAIDAAQAKAQMIWSAPTPVPPPPAPPLTVPQIAPLPGATP